MRVLAVGNMYPPHHLGGYELVWQAAMAHAHRQGHQVRVLTTDFLLPGVVCDEQEVFRELRWYWRDHQWPRMSWPSRVALERHNAAVLRRHLTELRPHVVSWWSMGGMSLSMIEQVRRAGIPAVGFVHDDWLLYGPDVDRWVGPLRGHARRAAVAERVARVPARVDIDAAARYVFVSETLRSQAQSAGYVLPDSAIARSGIAAEFLVAHEAQPWQWRLLYVGRIDERKGIHDAVGALELLPPEATLTIAGSGDQRVVADVRELAARLGIAPRIRELGRAARGELVSVYEQADAILFPVQWDEPWGLVPLEAMGLGRPVIATGRGGSAEYLRHGENCLLVRPGAAGEVADAVRRLAGDPQLRERLRTGGLRTAPGYTEAGFNAAVLEALEMATRTDTAGRESA